MKQYLIGIDVGTQSVKAVLFNELGERIYICTESLRLLKPTPDTVEQDPTEILRVVLRMIRNVMERSAVKPSAVAAVGIDAQMAGIMGVDANLNPTTPYDSWLDARCRPYAERMKQEAEEAIVQSAGGQIGLTHGPKILRFLHEESTVYRKTVKFLTLTAYLTMALCGLCAKDAFIDTTHLHFTNFADSVHHKWNEDLLHTFGIESGKMPIIRSPFEIAGTLTSSVANETGLTEQTVVSVGCGDTAASVFGAGITGTDFCFDIAGTASVYAGTTDRFCPDVTFKTLNYMASPIDGLWTPLAYINGGGLCLRWFRDMMGKTYRELDELADNAPAGCRGLTFVPHFTGRSFPDDPAVSGAFIGLKWEHTPGDLYRAILESVGYEYRVYQSILDWQNRSGNQKTVIGVGGGAKSAVFNQIKADILNYPYRNLEFEDTAPWGSAVLAGYACGLFDDLKSAVMQNLKFGVDQFPQHPEIYSESFERYKMILNHCSELQGGKK